MAFAEINHKQQVSGGMSAGSFSRTAAGNRAYNYHPFPYLGLLLAVNF